MTAVKKKLEEKQAIAEGKLTQAKGIVREQWGNLTNDEIARRAGQKDQVLGSWQGTYGNSWAVRNGRWILVGTAVTAFLAILTYFYGRKYAS